jgi:hypothetical protein
MCLHDCIVDIFMSIAVFSESSQASTAPEEMKRPGKVRVADGGLRRSDDVFCASDLKGFRIPAYAGMTVGEEGRASSIPPG